MDNPNFDLLRESFADDSFESSETQYEIETEDLTKEDDNSDDDSLDSSDELGLDGTTTTSESDSLSSSEESSNTSENGETNGLLPTSETTEDATDSNATSATSGTTGPSTKSNDSGPSETTSESKPEPDVLAYCEKGALSCYTFDQISNGHIYDYGPLKMPLHPDSGTTLNSWNLNTEFLQSFLVVTDSTSIYRPSQSWPFSNDSAGTDVWFSVEDSNVSDFTLIQIGQYLQLSYDDFGLLSCSTWEANQKITTSIAFYLDRNKPHHVSCRVENDQIFLRVWTLENSRDASPSSESTIKVWVADNPPHESRARFNGHIHALRIWDDPIQMRDTIEEEDFAILLLGD